MMHAVKARLSVAAILAAVAFSSAPAAGESVGHPWTLEDILLVPEVNEIALSRDGHRALYAAEIADDRAGKPQAIIRLVDIESGAQRDLRHANLARLFQRIPGTNDWSGLLDVGEGLQLYRIDQRGSITPLVVNPSTVAVGRADLSLAVAGATVPHHVGVLAYAWSPDGQWLWYSILKAKPSVPGVRFDEAVSAISNRRRSAIEAEVEFYLRGPDGQSVKVMTRPSSDRMAMYAGANILWRGDEIQFRVEKPGGTDGGEYEVRAWDRRTGDMRIVANERDLQTLWLLKGPHGGELATSGIGDRPELIETLSGGRHHSYGRVGFTIGDLRSAGIKVSRDGRHVVLGTRSFGNPRYGLAMLSKNGLREIAGRGSLTRCGFDDDLTLALCIEESMTRPPALVRVNLGDGKMARVAYISARHDDIEPLSVQPRSWVNRNGYKATGYVIFPRTYEKGRSYPAIIVTHGSDADDRFFDSGNQWNYPVQLFAERGYVVLLVNDPWPQQSEELLAAYKAWIRGSGPPEPETLQRLIWINGVQSFEDAVNELAAEGLVDPTRVGIAGYSRGSQMVNVAVTQSRMFRAASSGDGGFLEPAGYASSGDSYNPIYGGAPLSEHIVQYRRFSPSLNAAKVCAPVLQQVASASPSQVQLFEALRREHVPTQISYYPGASAASDETHLFHIPSNRLLAMRENMAWFDYWLLGKRDSDAPFPERLAEWDRMAKEAPRACGPSPKR